MDFLVLSFATVCVALLLGWVLLWRNGTASYLPNRSAKWVLITPLVLPASSLILAFAGIWSQFDLKPPPLLFLVAATVATVAVMATLPQIKRPFNHASLAALAALQFFRLPLEWVLWQLAEAGQLPSRMTFEGSNWDILIGATALPIAYVAHKWPKRMRGIVYLWNGIGLTLVLNIAIIGFLSAPGPLQFYTDEPMNRVVAHAPYVLLISFLVPSAVLLHLFSLQHIRRELLASKGD
jgi:hypothetical protein